MQLWMIQKFGNPSSLDHVWGWDASISVEETRQALAEIFNGSAAEINFTGCATESINTVIKGFVSFSNFERKKIVTCATEHDAVLAPVRQFQKLTGIEVEILPGFVIIYVPG
jgi:cysteine desulfurase